MSPKKQLLDPLGTMCKLVSLNFRPKNTKISIKDHILTLQDPNWFQCLVRWYNDDSRENISELYYAIIRLIKWFLVPAYKNINDQVEDNLSDNDNSNNHHSERIVQYNSDNSDVESDNGDGFDIEFSDGNTLIKYDKKDTKDNKNNNYNKKNKEEIEIIKDEKLSNAEIISRNEKFKQMVKYMCDGFKKLQTTYEGGNVVHTIQFYINILEDGINGVYDDSRLPKYIKDKEKEYENLLDYNKIKNLWDVRDIERICGLYENCFRDSSNDSIVNEAKQTFINGYLKSVDAILKMTDKKFQELVENSTKG